MGINLYISNPELVRQIIDSAKAGDPVITIEEKYPISRPAIERILKKENITPVDGRKLAAEKKMEHFPCVICSKLFHVSRQRYKSGEGSRTCSKECSYLLRLAKNNTIPQNESKIRELIKQNKTITEIAALLGINKKQLSYWAKQNHIAFFKRNNVITPENYRKIEDMINDGASAYGISTKLGLPRRGVLRILKNKIPDYKNPSTLSQTEILDRIPSGMELIKEVYPSKYLVGCKIHPEQQYLRKAADLKGGCIVCNNNGTSKWQKEIFSWISQLIPNSIDRYKIGRKELDIYIPELKLGIECHGLYYHSETFDLNKNKHLEKMQLANVNGIRLITIFEDEWESRQKQVKNFIKSVLPIKDVTVYARNCIVKAISSKEANLFLAETHILGKINKTKISLGLYHKDDLIAVMTGGPHHRGDPGLVLNRMSFKDGFHIPGGASKLFKYFLEHAKSAGYSKVISWSDNRWSEGNVYKVLGFTMESELPPDYSYTKGKARYNKQSLKKKKTEKHIGFTESDVRSLQGYSRIWDCGKKRWVMFI